jgi:hypothetical protein
MKVLGFSLSFTHKHTHTHTHKRTRYVENESLVPLLNPHKHAHTQSHIIIIIIIRMHKDQKLWEQKARNPRPRTHDDHV